MSTKDLHHWAYFNTQYPNKKVTSICIEKKDLETIYKQPDESPVDRVYVMPRWWSVTRGGSQRIVRHTGAIVTATVNYDNNCWDYSEPETYYGKTVGRTVGKSSVQLNYAAKVFDDLYDVGATTKANYLKFLDQITAD